MAELTHFVELAVLLMSISTAETITKETVTFCSQDNVDLRCRGVQVLAIHEVFYGRASLLICPQSNLDPNLHCTDPDALVDMSRRCFGMNLCFVHHTERHNTFQVNPCPGVPKYVTVVYSCNPPSTIHSICDEEEMIRGSVGFVQSPNYPYAYNSGEFCRKQLSAREGQTVHIHILDVNLEFERAFNRCDDRLVFMLDIGQSKVYCSQDWAVRSGQQLEWSHAIYGDQDFIETSFESSEDDEKEGFVYMFNVTGCPTADIPPPPSNGLIVSSSEDYVNYTCVFGYEPSVWSLHAQCIDNEWRMNAYNAICRPLIEQSTTTTTTTTTTTRPTTTTTTTTRTTTTRPTTTTIRPTTTTTPTITTTTTPTPTTTTTTTPPPTTTTTTTPTTATTTSTTTSTPTPTTTTTTNQRHDVTTPLYSSNSPSQGPGSNSTPEEGEVSSGSASESRTLIIIGCTAAVCAVVFVVIIVLVVRRILERQQVRNKFYHENADSLRPSKHACASMPNAYLGNGVGFAAKHAGSMSTNRHSNYSGRSLRTEEQGSNSTISFDSTIYEVSDEEGRRNSRSYDENYVGIRGSQADYITNSASGLIANEVLNSDRSLLPTIDEEVCVVDSARNSEISADSSELCYENLPGTEMRPRSLENTKRTPAPKPAPVDYPLFKDDTTGNLENYLDDRRVSV